MQSLTGSRAVSTHGPRDHAIAVGGSGADDRLCCMGRGCAMVVVVMVVVVNREYSTDSRGHCQFAGSGDPGRAVARASGQMYGSGAFS